MKLRKLLAMALASVMVLGSLAACGKTEEAPAPAPAETQAAPAETEAAPAETEATSTVNEYGYNVTWEDTAEVNFLLMCPGAIPPGLAEVEAAINEITETELDVHVNMEMVEMGNYIQQVSLKLSAQEKVDVMLTFPAGPAGYVALQNNKQIQDITDLLDTYAPTAKAYVADLIGATSVDGRNYALPIYRNVASGVYLTMRTDVLEDLGLVEKALNVSSFKEIGEILKAVKESEKWGNLSGLSSAQGNGSVIYNGPTLFGLDSFADNADYDAIVNDILVVKADGSNPTIQIIDSLEEFRAIHEVADEWYANGYIYKDSATDKEAALQLIKSGKVFATLQAGELGFEASAESGAGMDMTVVKIADKAISTSECNKFTWAIPTSSTEPEAAAAFLEALYTDARINNLVAWGIEGRDYVVDENGFADYPNGDSNVPYHGADFICGNQYITIPWIGSGENVRELAKEEMANSAKSYYLGFSLNTTPIETELATVNTVFQEYLGQVRSGVMPTSIIDEYLEKLEAAGIQTVIDEAQAQLDAWIASNK